MVDEGVWLLCGYVHDWWRRGGLVMNVGANAWGGRPASDTEIVELIEAGPRDLGVLMWETA
ncbi:hypothetical protein AGMMS50218_01070 [Actinomycetota bacterium]|nr:hypothetical protein AGMMS50218_01070 [Actinomycetota bacterium]